MQNGNTNPLSKLRFQWVGYALGSFLIIGLMHRMFAQIQEEAFALQWALQASAIMLIQLISLWMSLPLNHRQDETELLASLGPGNAMSLARGTIIALLTGFLFQAQLLGTWVWFPAILYIISDVTDFLDGYLARVTHTSTLLGNSLDMNNDALGVLVATGLAFQYGTVPWWYLPFGFARYLFLLGIYLRQRKGLPQYPLIPNDTRRLFAGLQMGFISVMLVPIVGPPATHFAATLFLAPFLGIFVIDYWQVTGQYEKYAFWANWDRKFWRKIFIDLMPLIMRALAVLIYTYQILTFSGIINPKHGSASTHHPAIFQWISFVLLALLTLGILSRVTAISALIISGIQLQSLSFSPDFWLLILALIYILFVGGGKYVLWKPEEWLIHNRPGQKINF